MKTLPSQEARSNILEYRKRLFAGVFFTSVVLAKRKNAREDLNAFQNKQGKERKATKPDFEYLGEGMASPMGYTEEQ